MEITTMNQTTMAKNIEVDKLEVKHVEEVSTEPHSQINKFEAPA